MTEGGREKTHLLTRMVKGCYSLEAVSGKKLMEEQKEEEQIKEHSMIDNSEHIETRNVDRKYPVVKMEWLGQDRR